MTRASLISIVCCLCLVTAAAAAQRMLSGELVVLDGGASRFRLVGQDGTFTAPPGTALGDLDGKDVEVELSSSGKVTQITERAVAITPITSGFETVSGQMIVRDPVARSFGLAGDNRVYVAPATIDIAPYGGKWVELSLDEHGQVTGLKLIAAPPAPISAPAAPLPPAGAMVAGAATCPVGDATVASGSTVCRGGITHRCDNGTWVSLGTTCR